MSYDPCSECGKDPFTSDPEKQCRCVGRPVKPPRVGPGDNLIVDPRSRRDKEWKKWKKKRKKLGYKV